MRTDQDLIDLARQHGTPVFVYETNRLHSQASMLLGYAQKMPFGLTIRYAAKANPCPGIVKLFDKIGLHFDASSTYEAEHLMQQGIVANKISLSSQTLQGPLDKVLKAGVLPVATSLHQMDIIAKTGVKEIAVRVNPGIGSGQTKRTNVGGPASSFGIWHEYIDQVQARAKRHNLTINRLHTHIGSGADPAIWEKVIKLSLDIAQQLPDVTRLDIGGGYKIARMPNETATDMDQIFTVFSRQLDNFYAETQRKIHLEIEPGTMLVAQAGTLLTQVEDIVDTGTEGYTFLRLDTGMNDILRPSLYGAQHPIRLLGGKPDEDGQFEYVVVGHNCESGDILTPRPGDPEGILPRKLPKVEIGDILAIGSAGAYCASMSAHGYNGYPSAKEVLI